MKKNNNVVEFSDSFAEMLGYMVLNMVECDDEEELTELYCDIIGNLTVLKALSIDKQDVDMILAAEKAVECLYRELSVSL